MDGLVGAPDPVEVPRDGGTVPGEQGDTVPGGGEPGDRPDVVLEGFPVVDDAVLDGHLQAAGEGEGADREDRVAELQQLQGFGHGAHRPAPLS